AEVCPTGATIFGTYPQIKAEAQRRRTFKAGEPVGYERRQLGSADIHEKPAPKYIDHVYGERELGGTQMMLMAGVPFEKLGLPKLPDRSYASTSETLQHTLYGGLIAPIIALGGLMAAAWRSTKNDHEQE
ncbi:MAG: hydrogenase 2 protein HybA, partial [Rhodospirillales bacterium]|nr:hydrogenase 2 protein HybA [Rhodospirillales bacterium]